MVEIKTKSGFGEKLFVGLNHQSLESLNDGNTITDMVSVVVYAEGNGRNFDRETLALIGHRDLQIAHEPDGQVFVYDDKKNYNYLPIWIKIS